MMNKIQMVDLYSQYKRIKPDIDEAIQHVIDSCAFINGPDVKEFADHLIDFTGAGFVVTCANGTDAIQIALMALGLCPGDEVIVPAFTYVATAEVIALLGMVPIFADVERETFNIDVVKLKNNITPRTKAIVPVHLFGQCADMEPILKLAEAHHLKVIEDAAQAIGAIYTFSDGTTKQAGTMGHMGMTSFFPSKNLACFGDGGAMFTNNESLAHTAKMIANHGQRIKYHHDIIGCNSRLDTIQAAILKVKLKHLKSYCEKRMLVAKAYDEGLENLEELEIPFRSINSTHVFNQYTLKIKGIDRDALKKALHEVGVPSMVYYPVPLYKQKAFKKFSKADVNFHVADYLSEVVLSLPMHTELGREEQSFIINQVQRAIQKQRK